MARRPRFQRALDEIRPGRLAPWPADKPPPASVAARVRYAASGEHKDHPSPSGEWTLSPKADKAKCQRIPSREWPRVVDALRSAIMTSCVDENFRGDFPSRLWVFVNDKLHEARLSNETLGEYHAFPLEYPEHWPDDPHHLLNKVPRVTLAHD